MKFATFIEYTKDNRAAEVRATHREYLASLKQRGKLAFSGPFLDERGQINNSGALIVYEAANADEARGLLEADPFHQAGVYGTYSMRPWEQVF